MVFSYKGNFFTVEGRQHYYSRAVLCAGTPHDYIAEASAVCKAIDHVLDNGRLLHVSGEYITESGKHVLLMEDSDGCGIRFFVNKNLLTHFGKRKLFYGASRVHPIVVVSEKDMQTIVGFQMPIWPRDEGMLKKI